MNIRYDTAIVEKQLLNMINAMVSHELRNPLNSIQNQNFRQNFLNEKMEEIIMDDKIKSMKSLKKKLR